MSRKPGVIALFDVDGTLTVPRKVITPEMKEFMLELRKHVCVGIVGALIQSKFPSEPLCYKMTARLPELVFYQDGHLIPIR